MRENGIGTNRGTLKKVTGIKNFDMADFLAVCPYNFEGEQRRTRKREVLIWRNVGMFYAYMSGYSLQKAGSIFDRDHATVIHALKNILTAYEGYGLTELVDVIKRVNDHHLSNVDASKDVNINYAISQVILDSMYSQLII